MTWRDRAREVASLDVRSLALFRIACASTILLDLYIRGQFIAAHYSRDGVLPASEKFGSEWHVSIHFLSDAPAFQAVLFAVAAVFGVLLLVGWQTRLVSAVSFFLLISLHSRNPILLTGGDTLLRAVLFWGIFLPLGARYSVDAALTGETPTSTPVRVASVASFGLIAQVCMVYVFTVMLKYDRAWWVDFDAVYYALQYDAYTTQLGVWLRDIEWVLPVLTFLTIAWELIGPYLALSPWRSGPLRALAVAGFLALHIGFGLCLNIGIFTAAACAGWLALVPTWLWEQAFVKRWFDSGSRRVAARVRASWPMAHLRPERPVFEHPRAVSVLLGCLLAYVIAWNIRTTNFKLFAHVFPTSANAPMHVLRLEQKWNLFAPKPATQDGWFVAPGRLANGLEVDVLRFGLPVTAAKPHLVNDLYPTYRWRKYLTNLYKSRYAAYRIPYMRWLCRDWNARFDGEHALVEVVLVYMREDTLPDRIATPRAVPIVRHLCGN